MSVSSVTYSLYFQEPVMNTYNNSVEVLSPNPPSEPTVEDQSFRTTKDDLLQQISKVTLAILLFT